MHMHISVGEFMGAIGGEYYQQSPVKGNLCELELFGAHF